MLQETIYLCTSVGLRNMFHELSPFQCSKYDSQAIIKRGKKMITGLLVMVAGYSPEEHLVRIESIVVWSSLKLPAMRINATCLVVDG